jgi:tetratricopeptide (TPR) repeat protein
MTRVCSAMTRGIAVAALTVAGLVLVAVGARAQSAPGSRVLVMPFAASADAEAPGGAGTALWLGEAAAVLLSERLEAFGAEALAREHRVAVFDQLQLPMSSTLLTRATMLRVGELIGASEVITGEIRLEATRLSVRARLVRLDTGRQLPEVEDEAPLADIFTLFDRLASRLAAAAGRVSSQPPPTPALPLETFENYIKGLVAATPAAQQRFLETAMAQAPHDARILMALWSVYTNQGAHEKALQAASAISADASLSRQARFAVAMSLIELRRFDGAFKQLGELHAERPAAAISNAIGVVQLRREAPPRTGGSAAYFARAIDEEPANTDYLFNLGYAHALGGDRQSALQWLRETVRYNAADGDAHLVMSALLAAAGRPTEAQRELDLARLLGTSLETLPAAPAPKVPPALERLRMDLDAASEQRLDVVAAAPAQRDQKETAAFHLDRGRRLVAQQRDREAVNELRRAIYLAPYEEEPHRLLGRVYQRSGRLEEAIDEFKVALWCRETVAGRIALGAALLEAGERDAARRELERALVLDPKSTEARELLQRIGGQPPAAVLTSGPLP